MTASERRHRPEELLTVQQAAARLCCSPANVYALIGAGELPFVCVGSAKGYRIDPKDLEAFVDRRKQAKQPRGKCALPPRPHLKHIRFK